MLHIVKTESTLATLASLEISLKNVLKIKPTEWLNKVVATILAHCQSKICLNKKIYTLHRTIFVMRQKPVRLLRITNCYLNLDSFFVAFDKCLEALDGAIKIVLDGTFPHCGDAVARE